MMHDREIRWVRLGEFVELNMIRNANGIYGENDAVGVNIEKVIRPMRGNITSKDFNKFFLIPPKHFAYNPRGSRKLGLGLNQTEKTYIITFNDIVFRIRPDKENELLDTYLFLYLSRKEWDRYAEYLSWGSSTEVFSWNTLCDIKIPVPFKNGEPDVERQQQVVDIWQGLRRLKEENEAIAQPLLELCQAKMDELKQSAPMVELGKYIEQHDVRNTDNNLKIESVRGLATSKEIISTKANMEGVSLTSYKIMRPLDIAYVADTSRRGDKVSIAHNQSTDCYLLSSISTVFTSSDFDEFDPTYLFLWFCRPEFDRYARFNSWGSARETFSWTEMCRVKVPKPSIDVQRAIVDIYHCARRAKAIAEEANQQLKLICPALVQHIIHSAV